MGGNLDKKSKGWKLLNKENKRRTLLYKKERGGNF